jgi:hypothetical protein
VIVDDKVQAVGPQARLLAPLRDWRFRLGA